ncbi:MAG: hypothetical protein NTV63_05375 [Candidatus Woesearchaeota archaeon]|nr:hypothetical protein [Candidatus Woesearchaeota archaeon]
MTSLEDIEKEVRRRLSSTADDGSNLVSQQFTNFRAEEIEEARLKTFFERYAAFSSQILPFIKARDESQPQMVENLQIARMNVKPENVIASSVLTVIMFAFLSVPFIILGWNDFGFFIIVTGLFLSYVAYTYPGYVSQIIKIRAQQESLLALLYMTIYMRVNPVLEKAIGFATEHLNGPLGMDLKRIIWLLDSGKVSSIKDAINMHMPMWIKRNKDFVKSFMILHSVILQSDKEHQMAILDKALSTILQDTYEKMKHFSHDLKMPVVILSTFGLTLPLIGLIAFPMISVFMSESIKISYLFFGYIIILPSLILFFSSRIISKRPGAFSAPDISKNPTLPPPGKYRIKFGGKEHLISVLPVAIIAAVILMLPGIIHLATSTIPLFIEAMALPKNASPPPLMQKEYDLPAMFITMTVPFGLAVGVFIFFYGRSSQKIKLRNAIIEIEDDLSASLYQISNQFTENIPVEIAIDNFIRNYELMNLKKKQIYNLFLTVVHQMKNMGITFEQAIFHPKFGIIKYYPSTLLKEIMWIFTESSRKGSQVIYSILNKISLYLEDTKKIKELIYDLLDETVSSIRMQAQFLAPFIAGIVGSLTLIIVKSLSQMLGQLEQIMKSFTGGMLAGGDTSFFTDFINFTRMTPPTLFQVLVGIYMIEAVILLSLIASGVENGFDEVARDSAIAKNVMVAIIVYVFVTIVGVVALNNLVQKGVSSIGIKSSVVMLAPAWNALKSLRIKEKPIV